MKLHNFQTRKQKDSSSSVVQSHARSFSPVAPGSWTTPFPAASRTEGNSQPGLLLALPHPLCCLFLLPLPWSCLTAQHCFSPFANVWSSVAGSLQANCPHPYEAGQPSLSIWECAAVPQDICCNAAEQLLLQNHSLGLGGVSLVTVPISAWWWASTTPHSFPPCIVSLAWLWSPLGGVLVISRWPGTQ